MTLGINAVDKEVRIDFDKLRKDRRDKIKESLEKSSVGSLLFFDFDNIRYTTSSTLGEWARDKLGIYCLLPKGKDPILFTIGSAVPLKKRYCPWLGDNIRVSTSSMKGAIPPEVGITRKLASEIYDILKQHGLEKEPVGIDISNYPIIEELQKVGLTVADGHQVALDAREVKTDEEVKLMELSCAIADGAFYEVRKFIKPGIRENEVVALVNKIMFERGCDLVECVNVESGERSNPHSHEFSDRMIRPGDIVYLDIMASYMGYRTCYYRTFFVGKPTKVQRQAYKVALDWLNNAIEAVSPNKTTADIAKAFPKATDFGYRDEKSAMCLQWGHGIGLGLYERPIISRLYSIDYPYPIVENNTFALETFAEAGDGINGVRLEEMVVVTKEGRKVITRYPINDFNAISCW